MIDLLLPTLKRPDRLGKLIESVSRTANNVNNVHFYIYVDNYDTKTIHSILYSLFGIHNITWIVGKTDILSKLWNNCYRQGSGDVLWHGGDDIIFETKGWDVIVEDYFKSLPDGIGLIYGQDGHQEKGNGLATHSFTSRKAADILGYFVPPFFAAEYNDTWLSELYGSHLGRMKYDERIMTRHLNNVVDPTFYDETYALRDARRTESQKAWADNNYLIPQHAELLKKHLR